MMASEEIFLETSGRTSTSLVNQQENIKVAVRLRPFTEKEKQRNSRRIVDIEQSTVVLYSPRSADVNLKRFTFDYSYWSHDGFKRDNTGVNVKDPSHSNSENYVGQEEVFEDLGQFLLDNTLKGYNSALLAYGQTGSGKSYTVSGYGQNEGILPRFARALFEELEKKAKPISVEAPVNEMSSDATNDPSLEGAHLEVDAADNQGSSQEPFRESNNNRYEIFFSMIEIYNEVVRDLLAKSHGDLVTQTTFARRGLKVREHPKHGFFVENLTSFACADKDDIERRIAEGQLNKSIAATSMNETSSRGHTIYEFKIKQYKLKSFESPEETVTTSVVQLVDLAGSERMAVHVTGQLGGEMSHIGARSGSPFQAAKAGGTTMRSKIPTSSASSTGSSIQQTSSTLKRNAQQNNMAPFCNNQIQQRFKESVSINQSLSALGNCIQVLSQYSQQIESGAQIKRPAPKIPYRDSVLTKLLNRCCLSGNSKVVIIATLSPADTNYDDTLSTLRFADRAKQIKTHATINRMSRSEVVDNLQKENERLKQIVDGRITRSDDSSQTSNFDDTENIMENFTGSKIRGKTTNLEAMASPARSRATVRKNKDELQSKKESGSIKETKLPISSSNPSLAAKGQLRHLVSPAPSKLTGDDNKTSRMIQKSRSVGQGLPEKQYSQDSSGDRILESGGDDFDDEELNRIHNTDEAELNIDISDIKEGLISPDSDDSFAALADEDLTTEEKISIFNRMLSNSVTTNKESQLDDKSKAIKNKVHRPRRASKARAGVKQVAVLSSSLKKSNPYLSNLNPDEQLTGIISYIIKQGETIVGKGADCDIVLHGPELRGKHARIIRTSNAIDSSASNNDSGVTPDGNDSNEDQTSVSFVVTIEPIFDSSSREEEQQQKEKEDEKIALMVNGSTVTKRTRLAHCDRLLFGTNAYFVYNDNINGAKSTGADLDLVTFDTARNEVLRKIMAEEKNEAMIKEINDYTHRPGTGRHKVKSENSKERNDSERSNNNSRLDKDRKSKLIRRTTVDTNERDTPVDERANESEIMATDVPKIDEVGQLVSGSSPANSKATKDSSLDLESQDANYRDQLMEDTYEYAMPVAEVNAVAKEMGIKVTYGLKILTGEEQLPDSISPAGYPDSNASDALSSSPADGGEGGESDANKVESGDHDPNDHRVTTLIKLDSLDIPPALYIKVHFEENNADFYWSKEKFQARRYKILELYGHWDVGGKSGLVEHLIDQSKTQGNYLIDPFIDDLSSTLVLIGHAQITLQPISHLTDIKHTYDILDLNDETVGSISIEAIPCKSEKASRVDGDKTEPYCPYSDEDLTNSLLESPTELLGKKLVFLLKILSCHNIPAKYSNIFCQYSLRNDSPGIQTKVSRDDGSVESEHPEENHQDLTFDHSHFICFEEVNQDMLDFLEHGFLTIQVVGQYRLFEVTNRSPTVISTIINSINKYKFKMDQQRSFNGTNYPGSVYCNSNTDSARSNRGQSGAMNSNSGASSVASTSATVNLFDQQNEDDEGTNSMIGLSQENIIDMILTKRKLDRAENQLHYLKRTVKIAEHYNKKHIPVKTVKKLLNSYGHELDSASLEEMAADVFVRTKS